MGRYASDQGGGTFEEPPVGTHLAIAYRIIDIGTQHGEYNNMPNVRNQVVVTWELPNKKMDDGKPYIASKFYTNSLNEKATLRADLEAWRGRAFNDEELAKFDLENILGKPCLLSIVEPSPGAKRRRVAGVSQVMDGMAVPALVNPKFTFWIDEWNESKFQQVPEGLQEMIKKSDEFKRKLGGGSKPKHVDPLDDDIPF